MINKQLINLSSPASSGGNAEAEQGLILHLDANDVDSYDGDGSEWVDISTFEKTIPLSDNADDLELHLNASDSTSYGGSGTTWTDISSNSNDGTILGATFDTDNGGYFNFDGSNDYISFPQFDISSDGVFTLEMWVNPASTQNQYANLFDYDHGSGGFTLQQSNQSTNNYYFYAGGVHITFYIPPNEWTQIVVTGNASNITKFYKNGSYIGTSPNSPVNTTGKTLNIGRWFSGEARYWSGKIGQVRIYSSELSASDIGQNYRHGRDTVYTDLIPDTDLELHLDADSFDGSTNTPSTWTDSSGNGNNGTITGATFDSELGNYLNITSDSSYIDVPTANMLDSDFTIEMWYNINSTDSNYKMLLGGSNYQNQTGLGHYLYGNTIKTWISISGTTTNVLTSPNVIVANKWQHIVLKREGSTWTQFVDGEQVGTATGSTAALSSPNSRIGRHYNNTGLVAQGRVGQTRIYSSALTQDQIRQNYNFTKPSYPNGNDGTITNATWNPSGYFDFNGSNSKVDLGTSFANNVSETTYAAWVNFDNLNTQNFIIFPDSGTTGNGFGFYDFGNGNIYFQSDNTTNSNRGSISNSGLYTTGQWVHMAQVYDGSATGNANRLKAYVNGNLLSLTFSGTIPSTTQATTYNTLVGTRVNSNLSLDGQISKVQIYDKALTQAEITALFNEGQ